MSIDVFGGDRDHSSYLNQFARGTPGKDALEITNFLPRATISIFRQFDMLAAFVVESLRDIETDEKGAHVKSIFNNNHEEPSLKLVQGTVPCEFTKMSPRQFVLDLKGKSIYSSECELFSNNFGSGFMNITFKTSLDRPQTLLYCPVVSYEKDVLSSKMIREVTVTRHEISIWGLLDSKIYSEVIMIDASKKYVNLFLEWKVIKTSPQKTLYTYHVNKILTGHFSLDTISISLRKFYFAGRPDKTQRFTGEMYCIQSYKTSEPEIPDTLRSMVIKSSDIEDHHTQDNSISGKETLMLSPDMKRCKKNIFSERTSSSSKNLEEEKDMVRYKLSDH